MKYRNQLLILVLLFGYVFNAQVSDLKTKFDLPSVVKETSGLLLLNGKLITHNDSGDDAKLYELDTVSGIISRTITISNATNSDWEDIAVDDTHIYIADIGNNNGTRTDLTIYKVLKTDYSENDVVTAEKIEFSYEDQTDFSSRPNNHNFDAEGIIIFNNDIYIFSKNWVDLKTNVYKIPKVAGSYTATKISTGEINCLITGAEYDNDRFFLTAYDTSLNPFIIYISSNRFPGEDIFASGFAKIDISSQIFGGSQIEGITSFRDNSGRYYISREEFTFNLNGSSIIIPSRLFEFYDDTDTLLSLDSFNKDEIYITPNPTKDEIKISSTSEIKSFDIFNMLGKKVLTGSFNNTISLKEFPKGVYLLKLHFKNQNSVVKKIVKH